MAGGYGDTRLSSTEILVTLAGVWRTVGSLPTAVAGLRGATLDNTVYMTGEWYTEIFIECSCYYTVMFQEDRIAVSMIVTPSLSTTRTRRVGAQLAR